MIIVCVRVLFLFEQKGERHRTRGGEGRGGEGRGGACSSPLACPFLLLVMASKSHNLAFTQLNAKVSPTWIKGKGKACYQFVPNAH